MRIPKKLNSSIGNRNPQGLYFDNSNEILYSTEHGPYGGTS